jgi:hypothetical protein
VVCFVAAVGLLPACGQGAFKRAATSPSLATSTEPPCPAGDPIRAVAAVAEHLRAGWLPDGFRLTGGQEENPTLIIEYGRAGAGNQPRVDISRHLTTDPPESRVAVGRTEPVRIHGQPGIISRGSPATPGSTPEIVAWHERPDVVLTVVAFGFGRADAVHVAEGLDYDPGTPGPTVAGPAPHPPPRCGVLPPGARTRQDMLKTFGQPGVTAAAKLVRLSDLQRLQPTGWCDNSPCLAGLVLWMILQTGPPGSFPHSGPAGAPPDALAGSWALSIHDAASGLSHDSVIGSGAIPDYWQQLDDIDPE